MKRYLPAAAFVLSLLGMFFQPLSPASAGILLEDTLWQGEVLLAENIVVPRGVTLTIGSNTVVTVTASESTKTDPEYMSSLTEITVRGTLIIDGTAENPVVFRLDRKEKSDSWAGIIIDGGTARLNFCTIQDAETAVWATGGTVHLHGSTLAGNRNGMVIQRQETGVNITGSIITGNEYGVLAFDGPEIRQGENRITGNSRKDFHAVSLAPSRAPFKGYGSSSAANPRELGDQVLLGEVIWQGNLLINGRIRLPAGSRLIILPGTVIEFRKKDDNGDGIGENGLMLQGVLIAKGTPEKPILFRSAEAEKNMGDWDAISIFDSDGARNIIEYCQIEDSYQGLHFHFANAAVHNSIFRNNYRGVQFQESAVSLQNNLFYANNSGLQARDSEITFTGNQLLHNVFGANFFRTHLTIRDNIFGSNLDFGLKIREGYPTVSRNTFQHNRFGLMLNDVRYGSIEGNLMLKNGESGLSVRSGANLEISANFIQANGFSGISIRDSMAVISDNLISENGERGIGVISLFGPITRNNFFNNGLYAIATEDAGDVAAPLNWFGQDDLEEVIYDQKDDPGRGRVTHLPVASGPAPFRWPLPNVPLDLNWYGDILVPETIDLPAGVTLAINPGAAVFFGAGAGMKVHGRLLALGSEEGRIKFTSLSGREPGSWGEIHLEHADGSRFSNCDFAYATWGIHSHFTQLPVIGCSFRENFGGIRFRSGPLLVRNSRFSDNTIGIRSFMGKGLITRSIITRNENGIFIRERGGDLTISNNNIFANNLYNIRIGDFNAEDVRAAENWWGSDNPAEKIFDANREPGIGYVRYEPALERPLDIEIVDPEQTGDTKPGFSLPGPKPTTHESLQLQTGP